MKTQNIIIAVVAILVIAGIAIGVYFASKSDSSSTTTGTTTYASNGARSGSLLDRLNAEIEAGAYKKKDQGGDAAQEGTA